LPGQERRVPRRAVRRRAVLQHPDQGLDRGRGGAHARLDPSRRGAARVVGAQEVNEHPYHNGSHRHLLSTGADAKAADVDAIIVPTARPADTLRHVIGLARHLGTKLVALCSRLSEAGEVRRIATEEGLTDVVPVDVPDASRLPLPDLATSKLLVGTEFERGTDLSLKRNLGLLLARMAGWRRVVFLADAITVPDAEAL